MWGVVARCELACWLDLGVTKSISGPKSTVAGLIRRKHRPPGAKVVN